jgi:hypothetical protein
MNESQRVDLESLEELAAYVDGGLDNLSRMRVETRLSRDDAYYEVLDDALSIPSNLKADEPDSVPAANPSKVEPGSLAWAALPIAATLALLLLWPPWSRQPSSSSQLDTLLATDMTPLVSDLDWSDIGWKQTRGPEISLGEQGTAFRLGSRLVDIEVAQGLGDSALARRLATEALLLGRSLSTSIGEELAILRRSLEEGSETSPRVASDRIRTEMSTATRASLQLGTEIESRRLTARMGRVDLLVATPLSDIEGDLESVVEVGTLFDALEAAHKDPSIEAHRLEELYREVSLILSR